ncbi:uncharacterized protein PFL1_00639 [Pseudozyma flocculosa PF-1]|uniref:uncharacterized protein n=1 Tax=Pseudozyma flocculosa PF-1 TaxID=1277687 RepID=UPI000456123F|nr:uncharacterized protein PFL1_00639 [Pseudozyma flocculosa PF-1]EPQ32443.1 hypothetical protein PFL1_00639 [Pseudozyma flocculosa PF-1]
MVTCYSSCLVAQTFPRDSVLVPVHLQPSRRAPFGLDLTRKRSLIRRLGPHVWLDQNPAPSVAAIRCPPTLSPPARRMTRCLFYRTPKVFGVDRGPVLDHDASTFGIVTTHAAGSAVRRGRFL